MGNCLSRKTRCYQCYLHTLPRILASVVARTLEHIAMRVATMLATVLDPRPRAIRELRATDMLRRNALFDPPDRGHEHIVLRVLAGIGDVLLTNGRCAVTESAVRHATDGEEAVELIELVRRQIHRLGNVPVVQLGALRADQLVLQTVVVEDLAAGLLEGREVALEGLDVVRVLGQCDLRIMHLPLRGVVRRVVDHVLVPVLGELERLARVDGGRRVQLRPGLHARVEHSAVLTIQRGEDVLGSLDLGAGQAAGSDVGTADQGFQNGLAESRVFNDAILGAIDRVALAKDFLMHDLPLGLREEGFGAGRAGGGIHLATPGDQVDKVERGGAHHNTIEVVGVPLNGSPSLATTGRASQVITLVETLVVKLRGEVLTSDDARVKRAVRKVLQNLGVMVEWFAGGSIVTIVGTHTGEAHLGRVRKIIILDT